MRRNVFDLQVTIRIDVADPVRAAGHAAVLLDRIQGGLTQGDHAEVTGWECYGSVQADRPDTDTAEKTP